MKTIIYFPFFILISIAAIAQQRPDIDTVQSLYGKINSRMNSVLSQYDPLFRELSILQIKVEEEVDILVKCEDDYRITLENYQNWADFAELKIFDSFNSAIKKRKEIENDLKVDYRIFLDWNDNSYTDLHNKYISLVNSTIVSDDPSYLSKFMIFDKKMTESQMRLDSIFEKYEKCRTFCSFCSCDHIFTEFYKNLGLSEIQGKRFLNFLIDSEKMFAEPNAYLTFMENYKSYYLEYLLRTATLKENSRSDLNTLFALSDHINKELVRLKDLVYGQLEKNALALYSDERARIDELTKNLNNEFLSLDNYYYLIEFRQSVEFIHSSLNPELNINEILSHLEPFLNAEFEKNSNMEILQSCCFNFLDNIDLLAAVISQYENVPYFTFKAYPQYSNEIVSENLEIIDSRVEFQNDGLGRRTKEFLELSELDLSNSNFSMDLLFKDHQNLRKLNLSNTQISSISYLVNIDIEWLDLSNTGIGLEDLQDLRNMPSIRYLDLSYNNFRRMDINELCFYLKIKKKNCIARRKLPDDDKDVFISEFNRTLN